MAKRLDEVLGDVPFFDGMPPEHLELVAGCASNVGFHAGELIARAGDAADTFFVVRRGAVAIELYAPGRGAMTVETIEAGAIVGWSWLFPPHRWQFDARALSDIRATSFDGACLRDKADSDTALGYDLMKRFAKVFVERLHWTRLRLLDVYGDGS
jgi:CRP-like cAMP-binding protein